MATLVIDYPQPRSPHFPAVLILLILLILALASITYGSHAVARHGSDAQTVRECLSQNKPVETWMNFDTGRQAVICQIGPGTFGIQIRKDGREITSFLKNKLSRIEQVYQYLLNRGYQFIR